MRPLLGRLLGYPWNSGIPIVSRSCIIFFHKTPKNFWAIEPPSTRWAGPYQLLNGVTTPVRMFTTPGTLLFSAIYWGCSPNLYLVTGPTLYSMLYDYHVRPAVILIHQASLKKNPKASCVLSVHPFKGVINHLGAKYVHS